MKRGGKILIFFGLFWSAITLLFNYQMGAPAVRQMLAQRFTATQGTILSSEVTEREGDEGPSYGVKLSYSFSVGDRQFVGKRYRYDTSTTSGSGWARRVVQRHPPGEQVTVYYDPLDPENCVLRPGIAGSDLFHFVFMTPFNAVMLGIWSAGWNQLRRKWRKPIAGGVKLRTELRKTHARMTDFSPLATGITVAALLAFASIFVVGFALGGFHPSLQTMKIVWAVILIGSFVAAIWHAVKILGGKYDLILDELNGTLKLPLTCGRKTLKMFPLIEIHSTFVDTIEKRDSEGSSTFTYVPTLRISAADGPTEKLAVWQDEDRAREFVAWLNGKLVATTLPRRAQIPTQDQAAG